MLLTPILGERFRSPVDRHEGFAALWQGLRVPDPIKNWGAARLTILLTFAPLRADNRRIREVS